MHIVYVSIFNKICFGPLLGHHKVVSQLHAGSSSYVPLLYTVIINKKTKTITSSNGIKIKYNKDYFKRE
jgi:hypothetical protein